MGDFLTVVGILIALIVGGIGILQSHKANQAAGRALNAASEASKTGEEALGIAKRTEIRSTEISNIHWEGHWAAIGVYCIVNKGDDDAHNVRAVVTVDDEEVRGSLPLVPGKGGKMLLSFPQASKTWVLERREYRQWKRDSEDNSMGFALAMPPQSYHSIRERMDWVTDGGAPGSYEELLRLADIGPEF
ncbi:hypothetical protein CGQ24_07400 [Arthrobacter sp. 7749]|nr:hypothetical protein CGQ24_07400 [Arthrobacter sp. 7749]